MKITDEIHRVDGADRCNVFVLLGDHLTLVDAGYPADAPKALATISRLGFQHSDLKRILLTHGHPDHRGGVPRLIDQTQAKVFAHEAEADLIERHFPLAGLLRNGDILDVLGGLRVVHTPGHTSGSICLYSPSRKVLFSGDALLNRGKLTGPNPNYTPDMPRAYRSIIDTIARLSFNILCVSHGQVITEQADEQVRSFAAQLPREID
jgi:glyoxylase-like metal-dependent hydrolase (beta-lactamase superfamily II)